LILRIIKLCISILFLGIQTLTILIFGNKTNLFQPSWIVLMYHSVRSGSKNRFSNQMKYLLKKGTPVSAEIEEPMNPGERYISVTFDDGYESVIENAFPVLKKFQIPTTMFIPSSCLGKKPDWVTEDYKEFRDEQVITEKQLKKITKLDFVTIGSHGATHCKLAGLEEERAKEEIVEAKKVLEQIIQKEVNLFSVPFGSYDKKTIQIAKSIGFKNFFLNIPIFPAANPDDFLIGRIDIDCEDWFIEYHLKMIGAYQWLPIASKLKRRLCKIL
jgi:peptidoglycan/xylan/chitin deacetylase (PgdA/CDA1 family)